MAAKDEATNKVEIEVERNVLKEKVQLSDGSNGFIFSRNPFRNEAKMFTYNCHICSVPNLPGERCLYTHISGRRHQTRLTSKPFDANLFRAPLQRIASKIVMNIAPGEPIPPGFENEIKPVAEIQSKIDKCRNVALIGLEYLLELSYRNEKEPGYVCVLCEKRGDPRTIMDHITSYKHRLKYLEKHFPTVTRDIATYRFNREAREVLPHVIQKLCEAIEDAHGRLAPSVYDNNDYEKNRMACLQEIINDKHFSEKNGSTFCHIIDRAEIDQWIADQKSNLPPQDSKSPSRTKGNRDLKERKRSLDSISDISSSSLDRSPGGFGQRGKRPLSEDDDVILIRSRSPSVKRESAKRSGNRRSRSHSRSGSRGFSRSKRRSRSRSISPRRKLTPKRQMIPTPRELAAQADAISAEGYKWEKYRCLVDLAMKALEKEHAENEKNPENHPLYPKEWGKFWNRRYKELQAEKKDPTKHDYKPEWVKFWTKRMIELHEEAKEKKKKEIRKNLNLPEDARERTTELKEKFHIKASRPRKESLDEPNVDRASLSKRMKTDRYDRSHHSEKDYRSGSRERQVSDNYKRYERDRISRERDRISRERDRISRDRDNREIERKDRIREREYQQRPKSRESYHDDSPSRHYSRDEPPEYYKRGHPYKWHAGQPKYYTSHYYGREPSSRGPIYEEKIDEEPELDSDSPVTVVTVLRLLTALEELLGPSLGPKVVELLAKALALEKVKANSADEMLLNDLNCVLLETVKEKLKAQLNNDMVEKHRSKAVRRAIRDIAKVVHMASEVEKNKTPEERQKEAAARANVQQTQSKPAPDDVQRTPEEEKRVIAEKIASALIAQGKKDVPQEELEKLVNYYYEKQRKAKEAKLEADETSNHASTMSDDAKPSSSSMAELQSKSVEFNANDGDNSKKNVDGEFGLPQDASSALESLTDADLQTLLQNFEDLSAEEQQHLHTYMKKLEASDPTRVEKLRKYVRIAFNTNDTNNQNERNDDDHDKRIETKYASKVNSNTTSSTDMFYDDTRDKTNKIATISDSDDDDDYEYDDLCKATSKKLKENELHIEQKSPAIISDGSSPIKPDQFFLGNEMISRNDDVSNSSSRGDNSNSRPDLKHTESIIANIMGSLQKNVQSRNFNDRNQTDATANNTDMKNQTPRHQIQSNIPFYQQQQLQQQQQQQHQSNSYNQSYNNGSDQMPNLNNQFFANEFNLGNQNMFNNNQSQNYNNIRPNMQAFGQQQPQLTNQQFAVIAQMQQEMSQQPNNRHQNNQFNSINAYGRSYR